MIVTTTSQQRPSSPLDRRQSLPEKSQTEDATAANVGYNETSKNDEMNDSSSSLESTDGGWPSSSPLEEEWLERLLQDHNLPSRRSTSVSSLSSSCASPRILSRSSTVDSFSEEEEEVDPLPPTTEPQRRRKVDKYNNNNKDDDRLAQYLAKREMSPTQERWNALTILPNPLYCVWHLWFANISVISWPQVWIALGICAHAPFSFVYHWHYAILHRKDPSAKQKHWSRRMDQAMIHVCSVCFSYGTTGSVEYAVWNLLYNALCIYWQFQDEILPHRNQICIFTSVLLYTLPLWQGEESPALFCQCWLLLLVSFWLFGTYPLKGWSHTCFHLVLCLLPPLLFTASSCRGELRLQEEVME